MSCRSEIAAARAIAAAKETGATDEAAAAAGLGAATAIAADHTDEAASVVRAALALAPTLISADSWQPPTASSSSQVEAPCLQQLQEEDDFYGPHRQRLGLACLPEDPDLPTKEESESWWTVDAGLTILAVAELYG